MVVVSFNSGILSTIKQTVKLHEKQLVDHDRRLMLSVKEADDVLLCDLIRSVAQEAVKDPFSIESLGTVEEEKFDIGDVFVVNVTKNNSAPQDQLITNDGKQWLPCVYLGKSKIEKSERLGSFHNFQAVYQLQDKTNLPAFIGYSVPTKRESLMWENIFRVTSVMNLNIHLPKSA